MERQLPQPMLTIHIPTNNINMKTLHTHMYTVPYIHMEISVEHEKGVTHTLLESMY